MQDRMPLLGAPVFTKRALQMFQCMLLLQWQDRIHSDPNLTLFLAN